MPNATFHGVDNLKAQQYLQIIKIIFVTLYTIEEYSFCSTSSILVDVLWSWWL